METDHVALLFALARDDLVYVLFPAKTIRYDHLEHCSGAENEATEKVTTKKRYAIPLLASKDDKTRSHLSMFIRQCVQENSSHSLDAFLALFCPYMTEEQVYSITDCSRSNKCSAADPIHFPRQNRRYRHEKVYVLADHGTRTVGLGEDLPLPYRSNLDVSSWSMDPFYEQHPKLNIITICRAFMPHVLALLAGLKAGGVVKPIRQLAVLRFIKTL